MDSIERFHPFEAGVVVNFLHPSESLDERLSSYDVALSPQNARCQTS
jgi:hypothetical protein